MSSHTSSSTTSNKKSFEDGTFENGTTIEEALNVSIQQLKDLNKHFPCRENSFTIKKMKKALKWLNYLTKDRIKRGVEGKHFA